MKYKVGDKVKIKTWKEMEKEYGLTERRNINLRPYFMKEMEEQLNENFLDRIIKIKENTKDGYRIKEMGCYWSDGMIKELIIPEPIYSRFEILDIREEE